MSLYEPAIEPKCPRPEYAPAIDDPEPPARRRQPPFETVKTQNGHVYRFKSFTIFTGYGLGGKWASFTIQEPAWQPLVICSRRDIAHLLKFNREEKSC